MERAETSVHRHAFNFTSFYNADDYTTNDKSELAADRGNAFFFLQERIHKSTPRSQVLILEGHDEDIMSFVAALRGLAVTCDFRDLGDSLIRDQIVRCANNKKIREKLLSIDPSLEESIQIARSMEHTEAWMREIDITKNCMKDFHKERTVEVNEFKLKKRTENIDRPAERKNTSIVCFRSLKGREPASKESPWWLQEKKQVWVDREGMKVRVMNSQERIKIRYDNRKGVKNVSVEKGDWVGVKKSGIVKKGDSNLVNLSE
ncbi:hypothetical protein NDU88_005103 [Pleurodeles waltl]|uniref:DUF4435 domain-containing protein n=1 Tax=Pleurodeles waltl TaxID=8319 RepID=A0AAV7M9J9_PLEWA|nr:hypothetical protein NDU88_005103 [Pleurodeles waltl]